MSEILGSFWVRRYGHNAINDAGYFVSIFKVYSIYYTHPLSKYKNRSSDRCDHSTDLFNYTTKYGCFQPFRSIRRGVPVAAVGQTAEPKEGH